MCVAHYFDRVSLISGWEEDWEQSPTIGCQLADSRNGIYQ